MRIMLTAAASFAACAALRKRLEGCGRQDLGGVCLRPLWNRGAAFGLPLPAEAVPPLSLAALAAVLPCRRRHPAAVGLILGGGLSNLWERVKLGGVFDYVQFPNLLGRAGRYVYNLADFLIFTGALRLLRQR